MAQFDFGNIDPYVVDGETLANMLNQWRDAIHSMHRGPTRPAYAVVGMAWLNDSGGDEAWTVMIYLGPDVGDVPFLSYNSITGDIEIILPGNTSGNPPGAMILFAGLTAPNGYLLCDGRAVSRADYVDLFSAIGTVFGSDDVDSFKLPDMRGRVAAGRDIGAGRLTSATIAPDGNTMGGKGGAQQEQANVPIPAVGVNVNGTISAGAHTYGNLGVNVQGVTEISHNAQFGIVGGGPAVGDHQHNININGNTVGELPITGNVSAAGSTNATNATTALATNVQPTLLLDYYIKW